MVVVLFLAVSVFQHRGGLFMFSRGCGCEFSRGLFVICSWFALGSLTAVAPLTGIKRSAAGGTDAVVAHKCFTPSTSSGMHRAII